MPCRQAPTCRPVTPMASSGPLSVTAPSAGVPTDTEWNRRVPEPGAAAPDVVRSYPTIRVPLVRGRADEKSGRIYWFILTFSSCFYPKLDMSCVLVLMLECTS